MASAMAGDERGHADRAELQEGNDGDAAGDDDRAEVGDGVEHAGGDPPDARLLETDAAEREPAGHADERRS